MLLLNPAWLLTLVLSSSPPNVTTLLCSQTLFTSKSLIATKSFLTAASERYTVREEKCYNQYRPYCFLYRMSDPITDPCSNNGSDTSIDGSTQSLSQHDIIARNNVYLGYRRVVPFFSFFFFFRTFRLCTVVMSARKREKPKLADHSRSARSVVSEIAAAPARP